MNIAVGVALAGLIRALRWKAHGRAERSPERKPRSPRMEQQPRSIEATAAEQREGGR